MPNIIVPSNSDWRGQRWQEALSYDLLPPLCASADVAVLATNRDWGSFFMTRDRIVSKKNFGWNYRYEVRQSAC
jgi:hypothetical protein